MHGDMLLGDHPRYAGDDYPVRKEMFFYFNFVLLFLFFCSFYSFCSFCSFSAFSHIRFIYFSLSSLSSLSLSSLLSGSYFTSMTHTTHQWRRQQHSWQSCSSSLQIKLETTHKRRQHSLMEDKSSAGFFLVNIYHLADRLYLLLGLVSIGLDILFFLHQIMANDSPGQMPGLDASHILF